MAGKRKREIAVVGLFDNLLELIFPVHCRLCDSESGQPVCRKCLNEFNPIFLPLCRICGSPLNDSKQELCRDCNFNKPRYILCRSPFYYNGRLKEALTLLKFKNKIDLYPAIFKGACEYFRENEFLFPAKYIIPVPSHRQSYTKVNNSASQLFASAISQISEIPVLECLSHTRKIKPQHKLNSKQRWENVKEAFIVKRANEIKGRTILLVDDIITTGATVSECSKALFEAGAGKIYVFTFSRTAGLERKENE